MAVVVFAAKHGWRGAVVSILAVSVVLAVEDHMNNIVRHAGATQAKVRLRLGWRRGEPWLIVTVEDDGAGFSPSTKPGNGLHNMRDRALMLGGDLRIGSAREGGTRLRAWLRAVETPSG